MGRLIDADKFISWLDCGHLREPSEKCLSELNVKQMIDNQPTAYDVEKVVEGLKLENKRLKTLKNNCIALCDHEVIGIENKAYDYAIKIVKGVVKDE